MAATGVTGGVLYNLVKSETQLGAGLAIASVLCTVAVLAAECPRRCDRDGRRLPR
jgi:hypothetical protein